MLEAEWDETAGKVVFRKPGTPSGKKKKETDDWRASQNNQENLSWRNNHNNSRRRSRPSSKGIAAQSFHQSSNNNEKPGQEAIQRLRQVTTQRAIQQETAELRKQQEWKRQAFKSVTVYKTYPLQDRALVHLMQLRREWGVEEEQDEKDDTPSAPSSLVAQLQTCSSASSSSSSSGVSSLDVPEAKRCLRDRAQSPAQSRLTQQYRTEFLQQRQNKNQKNLHSLLGPALWSMEPRIFGMEQAVTGKRRYVVAHAGRFLDHYWRKTEAVNRHAYELIRPRTPCRLYMDLECSVQENPVLGTNIELQERLLTELFVELAAELENEYGGEGWTDTDTRKRQYNLQRLQRSQIVDLDSSTSNKFSRHWIVHLYVHNDNDTPMEALFEDAAAVGYFLRQFVGRLAQEQATGQLEHRRPVLHEHLFVQTNSKSAVDGTSCLIDLGVYTRNRLFRLMGSSKFGKPVTAALRIAETNEFAFPETFHNDLFYVPAMMKVRPISQNDDDIEVAVQKRVSKTDWTIHAEALAQTFVVPLNSAKFDHPILPCRAKEALNRAKPVVSQHRSRSTSKSLSHGASPYPMIDDFVSNELAHRGGIQGSIRAWSIEYDQPATDRKSAAASAKPLLISYQMSRNRWCECVGRAHRSNNIAWHVDIRMQHCYQTCHDPDCRALNFRGTPVPLPEATVEALQDALFEEELARLDLDNLQSGGSSTHDDSQPLPQNSNVAPVDEFSDESFDQALAALNLDEITSTAMASTVPTIPLVEQRNNLSSKENRKQVPSGMAVKPRRFKYLDDSSDDNDDEEQTSSLASIKPLCRPLQDKEVAPSPEKELPCPSRSLSQRYAYLDIDLSSDDEKTTEDNTALVKAGAHNSTASSSLLLRDKNSGLPSRLTPESAHRRSDSTKSDGVVFTETKRNDRKLGVASYLNDSSSSEDDDDQTHASSSKSSVSDRPPQAITDASQLPETTVSSPAHVPSRRFAYLDIDLSSSSDEDDAVAETRLSRDNYLSNFQCEPRKPTAVSQHQHSTATTTTTTNEDDSTEIVVPPETAIESLRRQLPGSDDSDTSSPLFAFRRRQRQAHNAASGRSNNSSSSIRDDDDNDDDLQNRSGAAPSIRQRRQRGFLLSDSSDEEDIVELARRSELARQRKELSNSS